MKTTLLLAGIVAALVIAHLGGAAVVVMGVVGLLLLVGGGASKVTGRAVTGHGHAGDKPKSARHEAGHAAVGRRLGRVHSATLNKDGSGFVDATLRSDDPTHAVAFLAAGRLAAGTGRGAEDDKAAERRILARVPKGERGKVRRDGERLARRIVSSESGRIRRDATRLMQDGRL